MSENKDNVFYYLWLQKLIGVGSSKLRDIIEYFGSAKEAFLATEAQLNESNIFSKREITYRQRISEDDIKVVIDYCQKSNIRIITPEDEEYPECFNLIESPPTVIFAKGQKLDMSVPHFGIVGSRRADDFGKKAAFSLAARLSLSGFTIVSGGALGVDKMAHLGAIASGKSTVVVMGSGIDSDYLKSNAGLRKKALEKGTLISEFWPKSSAVKFNFPIRNRLISALSSGVAVIEAGCKSGALITASYAMEQGKEIFAMPGSINDKNFEGNNNLIRDGAIPLLTVEDILAVYSGRFEDKITYNNLLTSSVKSVLYKYLEKEKNTTTGNTAKKKKADTCEVTDRVSDNTQAAPVMPKEINACEVARKIYNAFKEETEMADVLSLRSGVTGATFIAAVTELELKGYIKAVPVGRYKRL